MKKTLGVIILIIIIAIISLVVWGNKKTDTPQSPREEAIEESETRPEITINTKHQYKDGEHIFVGYVNVPTPCNDLSAEIVDGEVPEIKLTVSLPKEEEVCAEVITTKEFTVKYKSDNRDLKFKSTLNDEKVLLNLFEIEEDEDIYSVDLFIKG